uniref:uncharacterized protein LOC113474421 isoform X2 n=1 Tax=Ciona intestinalis TaxID=7719 RepID=UPI000EF5454F|nr:uncharacterized protein LOC113474421 isoform X2 [Ciona intestinalis]|eukprot:XP_026691259.1 uncharacterized protein LOC113474421 isoform X2 [Ciona intestinalis]
MRCVFKVLVFSLNFICLAAQGRQQLVARTTPSPEYVELLKEFWPNYNERCPTGYLMCRDESFCFDEAQLCGGNDVCIDSSDDINAICLGITRPLTRVTTPRLTTSELVTRMTTTGQRRRYRPLQQRRRLRRRQRTVALQPKSRCPLPHLTTSGIHW